LILGIQIEGLQINETELHSYEEMSNKTKLPGLLSKLCAAVKSGHHEKRRDVFDEEFDNWSYAVKGKTVDDKYLRIIVSFESPNFIVVTAIDLER
jgi:hypothetical protein